MGRMASIALAWAVLAVAGCSSAEPTGVDDEAPRPALDQAVLVTPGFKGDVFEQSFSADGRWLYAWPDGRGGEVVAFDVENGFSPVGTGSTAANAYPSRLDPRVVFLPEEGGLNALDIASGDVRVIVPTSPSPDRWCPPSRDDSMLRAQRDGTFEALSGGLLRTLPGWSAPEPLHRLLCDTEQPGVGYANTESSPRRAWLLDWTSGTLEAADCEALTHPFLSDSWVYGFDGASLVRTDCAGRREILRDPIVAPQGVHVSGHRPGRLIVSGSHGEVELVAPGGSPIPLARFAPADWQVPTFQAKAVESPDGRWIAWTAADTAGDGSGVWLLPLSGIPAP